MTLTTATTTVSTTADLDTPEVDAPVFDTLCEQVDTFTARDYQGNWVQVPVWFKDLELIPEVDIADAIERFQCGDEDLERNRLYNYRLWRGGRRSGVPAQVWFMMGHNEAVEYALELIKCMHKHKARLVIPESQRGRENPILNTGMKLASKTQCRSCGTIFFAGDYRHGVTLTSSRNWESPAPEGWTPESIADLPDAR